MARHVKQRAGDGQYAEATALVAERSGMVFAPNRRVEAEAGLARAMRHAGATDFDEYLALVRLDPAVLDHLVDELRVGETHFMRDPDQMDLLRREVLPALRRRRGPDRPARVWSAGCASGEEAYTLAILLEEAGLLHGAMVLGTDLSPAVIARARAGSYSDWSMRGVSEQFLQAYFNHVRGRRILVERIRSKARFEALNLIGREDYAAAGAYGMDLILCRNVLIYFSRETVERIAARLFDCLAEGGVLLTAGADPLIGEYAPFDVELTPAGLLYRRPGRVSAAVAGSLPARAAAPEVRPLRPAEAIVEATAPVLAQQLAEPEPREGSFDQVVTLANGMGAFEAEQLAQAALKRHPLDAHLHYLRATLLLALEREEEAEREGRRAVYLDPSLAIAHFLLGTILRKRGVPGALRAFRNARDLCAARPADEPVPAGAGERIGALHSAASAEMKRLEVTVG
jgi:chemotaxis protein methyltransferase CheR